MKYQFEKCLDKGKIIKIKIDQELFEKELIESRNDIESARISVEQGNFK
jgi:hypothetical protein